MVRARQKKYFDRKSHCAVVKTGDRVLVKIVALEGRHKISDRWERDPYNVLSQSNVEIPVFKVEREDGIGPVCTLHINLLFPIGNLPIGQRKVTDNLGQLTQVLLVKMLVTSTKCHLRFCFHTIPTSWQRLSDITSLSLFMELILFLVPQTRDSPLQNIRMNSKQLCY